MIRIVADASHAGRLSRGCARGMSRKAEVKAKRTGKNQDARAIDAVCKDQKSLNYKTESCECTNRPIMLYDGSCGDSFMNPVPA